jgi:hypothetical protein
MYLIPSEVAQGVITNGLVSIPNASAVNRAGEVSCDFLLIQQDVVNNTYPKGL